MHSNTHQILSQLNNDQLSSFIDKLANQEDMIQKFSVQNLIKSIDSQRISQIQRFVFDVHQSNQPVIYHPLSIHQITATIDLLGFVKGMLRVIEHQELETLFLAMALIDLYKQIQETFELENKISLKDLTNFLCDNLIREDYEYQVKARYIPPLKKFNQQKVRIRKIDNEEIILKGENNEGLMRLIQNKIYTDNQHHNNQRVRNAEYSPTLKQIFLLDVLSRKITVFSDNCDKIADYFIHQNMEQDKDIIIMNFAFSETQQRLGLSLKTSSLSFWDVADNFKCQKTFNISSYVPTYQSNIWYLEHFNEWITTDSTNVLTEWDLNYENVKRVIGKNIFKENILGLQEIPYLQVLLVGCLDKKVYVINYIASTVKSQINLEEGGFHSLIYDPFFQVILIAGYCNDIKIFSIHHQSFDPILQGELRGHSSMISSIQVINDSPMIISSDDNGIIKLWDIRTFKCLQSISIGTKTVINKILHLDRKVALFGSRLYIIQFEDIKKQPDLLQPIYIDYSFHNNSLIVVTRKDVRFYNMHTGRLLYTINNLTQEQEEEITSFKVIKMGQQFIVGNQRGNLNIYSFEGILIQTLDSLPYEVSNLKIDAKHKLFLTLCGDTLHIQQQQQVKSAGKHGGHTLRSLKHQVKINLVEFSVYHSLVFTAADNLIYVWDYEFGKLVKQLKFSEDITAIQCVNLYSLLLISTNNGRTLLLQFHLKDSIYNFRILAQTNQQDIHTTKFLNTFDLASSFFVYQAMSDGQVIVLDFKNKELYSYIKNSKPAYERLNYNALRVLPDQQGNFSTIEFDLKMTVGYDVNFDFYEQEQIQAKKLWKNALKRGSILQLVGNIQRKIIIMDYDDILITQFQAHNEQITSFSILEMDKSYLMTGGYDNYVKIWDKTNLQKIKLLCLLNLNHPLPMKWSIQDNQILKKRRKILFAIKVIDVIFKRYRKEIIPSEEKQISLKPLFTHHNIFQFPQVNKNQVNQVILMKDEYSPRDLHYEKVKEMYKLELQGYSVQQLEKQKEIRAIQEEQKEELKTDIQKKIDQINEAKIKYKQQILKDDEKDKDKFAEFLDPKRYEKLLQIEPIKKTKYIQQLEHKLNDAIRPQQQIVRFPSLRSIKSDSSSKSKLHKNFIKQNVKGISKFHTEHYRNMSQPIIRQKPEQINQFKRKGSVILELVESTEEHTKGQYKQIMDQVFERRQSELNIKYLDKQDKLFQQVSFNNLIYSIRVVIQIIVQ